MAIDEERESTNNSGLKKLVAAFTLLLLLGVGLRVFLIYKTHRDADKPAVAKDTTPNYTEDQMVLPRQLHQDSLKDARELNGKPLWTFAAGQLNAYPATPARVDYTKPGPLLKGAERVEVVNFIEQKAAPGVFTRIPAGDMQVVMLFHRASDPAALVGTPVGYREGKFYTFYLDEAFFYDDPHVVYKHWPVATWKAIDEHRAIDGMNERQAQLALGQVSKPGPGQVDDRTVVYDNDGKPVTIRFTGGHGKIE